MPTDARVTSLIAEIYSGSLPAPAAHVTSVIGEAWSGSLPAPAAHVTSVIGEAWSGSLPAPSARVSSIVGEVWCRNDRKAAAAAVRFGFSVSAAGEGAAPVTGSSQANFGFSVASAGHSRIVATASANFGFNMAAAAQVLLHAQGTALFGFTINSGAHLHVHAAGTALFGFRVTASSSLLVHASASARFGFSVGAGAGYAVDYAIIEGGIVTGSGHGVLPASTDDIIYFDVIDSDEWDIGWYFNEDCGTFSFDPPVIEPGEIAPPYPPGHRPPAIGDPEFPPLDNPGEPVPAETIWIPLSFHANAKDPLTVTACPAASQEISDKLRTWYNFERACSVRMEAQVQAAVTGSRIRLKYTLDDGATWFSLSKGRQGPIVKTEATGNDPGRFLNVHPDAQDDVMVSPFSEGGDDATDLVVGNLLAMIQVKTNEGDACDVITEQVAGCNFGFTVSAEGGAVGDDDGCTPADIPDVTPGPGGYLFREDFTGYADRDALRAAYDDGNGIWYSHPGTIGDDLDLLCDGDKRATKFTKENTYDMAAPLGAQYANVWWRAVQFLTNAPLDVDARPNAMGSVIGQTSDDGSGGHNYHNFEFSIVGTGTGNPLTSTDVKLRTELGNTPGVDNPEFGPIPVTEFNGVADWVFHMVQSGTTITLDAWLNGSYIGQSTLTDGTSSSLKSGIERVAMRAMNVWRPQSGASPYFESVGFLLFEAYDGTSVSNPYGL